jgi:hypothetical protein
MLSPNCLLAGVATSLRNAAHQKKHPQFSFKGFYVFFPDCTENSLNDLMVSFLSLGIGGRRGEKIK